MEDMNSNQPVIEHSQNAPATGPTVPHVVIVGRGFGDLNAAKKLGKQPVRVTLIDRNNYHLFQPMLYQVATSGLVPANISAPIRYTLHTYKKNTTVLLDEVTGVDTQQQLVLMRDQPSLHYDYLILATGAESNYFAHPEWESDSPGMKTLADGLEVQQTILVGVATAAALWFRRYVWARVLVVALAALLLLSWGYRNIPTLFHLM